MAEGRWLTSISQLKKKQMRGEERQQERMTVKALAAW
jgi:hypothetical protein